MAIQSPLSPRSFTDPTIFAAEQSTLFHHTWQFAGLTSDVQNDKDFITGIIGQYPFVIQNFHGKLAAFHNVCTHRSAPLQNAERGNRGLYCQYHGWTFDSSGLPVGIPHNNAFYPISAEEAKCLATKSFSLEVLGNLLFISIAPHNSLREQLGEHFDLLKNIGNALDKISFRTCIQTSCNWKLLIHNAYDDIHAQFVHPQASLDTSEYTSSQWDHQVFDADNECIPENYSKRHALFKVQITEYGQQNNRNNFKGTLDNPVFKFNHYLHLVLFPNLVITSVQGLWYNIIQYRPTSPNTTELDLLVIPSQQENIQSEISPEILYRLAIAGLRIFQEDIDAVESSQRYITSVKRHATLGERENKIYAFDAACVNACAQVGVNAGI